MNRLVSILVAALAVVIGLLVGTLNADKVQLDLLWFQLQLPLGLLLLLALAAGFLAGLAMIYLSRVIPLRMKVRRLQAEASRTQIRNVTGSDG
jgi:putative membrane protein